MAEEQQNNNVERAVEAFVREELKKEDDEEGNIVNQVTPPVSTTVKTNNKQEEESRRITRQAKEGILSDEMKFMSNFDPANSMRRQKKNRRRYFHPDGRPFLQAQDYDDCDCLNQKCPGCHFPCKNCGDTRCGHECRVNRRWVYESVEVEGWNRTVKNQHLENFYNLDYD